MTRKKSLFKPGENCWKIENAQRAAFLVDGENYFLAAYEAIKKARKQVFIISWDIDSRFRLVRDKTDDDYPNKLGEFLDFVVQKNPELDIYVLSWDYAMIYSMAREWLPEYKLNWKTHERFHFKLDDQYPLGSSHHQKIIVIDDLIAFSGGLDLTFGRWDSSEHYAQDNRRIDIKDQMPQPYHDIQMLVDGNCARALGELARDRWKIATGESISAPDLRTADNKETDPWPEHLSPDITNIEIAISRTAPAYKEQKSIREIEDLLLDLISSATESIYIENQYFTSEHISNALISRLKEKNGPEIVILLPEKTDGWLSQNTMDVLRERLLKNMIKADKQNKLRIYSPTVPGLGQECINVHAKCLIIDSRYVRIGSANFNNRSMSLDTECDLTIYCDSNGHCKASESLRNRLLAEHLGTTEEEIGTTIKNKGSISKAIEENRGGEHTLRPFCFRVTQEQDALVPEGTLADPELPFNTNFILHNIIVDEDKESASKSIISLVSILFIILLLTLLWRWTGSQDLLDIEEWITEASLHKTSWTMPLLVLTVFIVASLTAFPVTILIITSGLIFGSFHGSLYALAGSLAGAMVTYAIGQKLGHSTVRKMSNEWVAKVSRRLARQGLLAIITLRVVPVAPFTIINIVAGASHIRFKDFVLGTLIGMIPGILALTVFSDQVARAISSSDNYSLISLLLIGGIIIIAIGWLNHWIITHQDKT